MGYESGFEALKDNKYDAASFRFFVSSVALLGWGCQYGNDIQSSLTNLFGKGVDGKTTSIWTIVKLVDMFYKENILNADP